MTIHIDGLRPDRATAPAPHDFSPSTIMSWATAHAAEQAWRASAKLAQVAPVSSAEILAGIEAALAPAEPARRSITVMDSAALLADMGRAIEAQVTAPSASADSGLDPKSGPQSTGRRLALFGAAAALLAPPLARPAAARVSDADAELARLADEIDRTLDGAAYALEPVDDEDDQNRRLRHAEGLMLRMVDVAAVGLAGVKAKAKGYLDSLSYDVLESAARAQSLAEDAERVCAGVLA